MHSILLALFLHQVTLPKSTDIIDDSSFVVEEQNVKLLTVRQTSSGVQSFPAGSQRVPFIYLSLSASCKGSVSFDGIRFKHKGLGSVQDIESVYLFMGNKRLLRGRQVRRDGTVDLNFRSVTIPACKTVQLTLMADFSSQASIVGEHLFTLEKESDIFSDAEVTFQKSKLSDLNKPMVIGGAVLGNIEVTYPKLLNSVHYGDKQKILRIRLEADKESDHKINAITLTNHGSATYEDIRQIYFETGMNERVSEIASSLDGDRVRLTFNPPFILKKNQKRLLTLRADVRASRSRTLQFVIEEPSDIESDIYRPRTR